MNGDRFFVDFCAFSNPHESIGFTGGKPITTLTRKNLFIIVQFFEKFTRIGTLHQINRLNSGIIFNFVEKRLNARTDFT